MHKHRFELNIKRVNGKLRAWQLHLLFDKKDFKIHRLILFYCEGFK